MLIKWDEDEILLVNIKNFKVVDFTYKKWNHIDIDFNEMNKEISHYIEKWHTKQLVKNIILSSSNKYYFLENCYPKNILIGIKGNILSSEFNFVNIKDITRKFKINKLLNII